MPTVPAAKMPRTLMGLSRLCVFQVGVFLSLVLLCACEYEGPGVASGLNAQSLTSVHLGMSSAEVRRVLGTPLSDSLDPPSRTTRRLIYARSRRLSLGDSRHLIGQGQACGVLLEDDAVSEVYFIDTKRQVMCSCRPGDCPQNWTSACVSSLPSR